MQEEQLRQIEWKRKMKEQQDQEKLAVEQQIIREDVERARLES